MKSTLHFLLAASLVSAILSSCSSKTSVVQLKQIKVEKVPDELPNGQHWDPLSGNADIYMLIQQDKKFLYRSEVYENSSLKNTYIFKNNLPMFLTLTEQNIRVDLFDADELSADEWMGGFDLELKKIKGKDAYEWVSESNGIRIALELDWKAYKNLDKKEN
ncbi:MAG: hypothetical protein ACKOZY_07845 [Flavobacteriales bacterium]